MDYFALDTIIAEQASGQARYHEFLRRPSLSMGLYVLPTAAEDEQQPHGEDEVYVVLEGSGAIDVDGRRQPVSAGSVIFVAARVPHRFVDIDDTLRVLVFFAPAEGSTSDGAG